MDCAFSLMDAFSLFFFLFTKEKERERAGKPKKQAMDETAYLMDEKAYLMDKTVHLMINFCSTINDLAKNNGKSIKFVYTTRQPLEILHLGKKI